MFTQLEKLTRTIAAKSASSADTSYTAQLLAKGVEKCAKKFGEESVELALASMTGDKSHIAAEAADVLYHLLVLLQSTGVKTEDVMQELARREGASGLAEKASRRP
jgi:phosphoribosyl-ATP pyrophosphohydrolase